MRLGLVLLALVGATASAGPAKKTTIKVLQHPTPACGGAVRPPLPPGAKPPKDTPAARVSFVLRKGKKNSSAAVAAEVTTDDAGQFTATLPRGTYCLVTVDKRDVEAEPGANIDRRCFYDWIQTCDAVITAPTRRGHIAIDRPCMSPCYNGPKPP